MQSESKPITFLAIYVAFTLVTMALTPIPHGQYFFVGFSLGSLFSFTLLTTVWIVFGPGSRWLRWPIAMMLLGAIVLAFATKDNSILAPVLVSQLAIVLTTLAISGVTWWHFGARMQMRKALDPVSNQKALSQFGVRHLLIMMAVAAVLLSMARLIVPHLSRVRTNEIAIFTLLAFAACVLCFPVLLSQLSLKRAVWPTLLVLGFAVFATWSEVSLLALLRLSGPDFYHFAWINFFSLLPVLLVSGGLRWCGYRLVPKTAQQ